MIVQIITAAGFFRRRFWDCTQSKRKEKKKSSLVTQVQEFLRIHGFVIMGNTEMDMTAER